MTPSTPSSVSELMSEVRKRLEDATPGPWVPGYPNAGLVHDINAVCTIRKEILAENILAIGDRELIANAPTDLRRLLEIVELQQKALEFIGCHGFRGNREECACTRCKALSKADAIAAGEGATE